jgi:hypothetical protein
MSGDGWRKRYSGFVKEQRNPFLGVSVVGGRAAAECESAVIVPDELSATEHGDEAAVAGSVNGAVVHFHGHTSGYFSLIMGRS